MSESNNTNTLVLLLVGGGLYYMKNVNNTTEKKDNKGEEENDNQMPFILALVIVFSLKKEIEETISKERVYTLLAISVASYLHTIDADIVKIFGSTFATLIMLPAIQEYEKK
tara:strand:+ start:373 stop:708 length:336 start_codon:yes stop_codon:yes gene_type:complete